MDVPVVTPATAAGVATVPALPPRTPFASTASALAPAACAASDAPCRSPGVAIGITVVVLLGIALILMLLLPRRAEEVVVVRDDALRTAIKAAAHPPTPAPGAEEIDEAGALSWLGGGHHAGQAAVLMVYAPWCGACKATKPGYDAAAAVTAATKAANPARFLMVDGMKARGLMSKHGVTAFPTIFGIRADGRVVRFPAGTARGKEQLLAFAAKLAANAA